jgi:hypothetical protein
LQIFSWWPPKHVFSHSSKPHSNSLRLNKKQSELYIW